MVDLVKMSLAGHRANNIRQLFGISDNSSLEDDNFLAALLGKANEDSFGIIGLAGEARTDIESLTSRVNLCWGQTLTCGKNK